MKNNLRIFLYSSLLLISVVACTEKKSIKNREDANVLFSKTTQFLLDNIALIENARDSLTLDSLVEATDKGLTSINFSVQPQTDLLLSEQENDSIIKLIETFNHRLKLKFISLSYSANSEDSISFEEDNNKISL